MARRGRAKRDGRDLSNIANRQWSLPTLLSPSPPLSLAEVEDRRTYHPLSDDRPNLTLQGLPATIVIGDPPARSRQQRSRLPHTIKFKAPTEVITCVRRSQRRQVLFAANKAGKGRTRRPRRSWRSSISCKR